MEEALQRMDEALKSGARQIDYLMWRDGDRPKERVPAGKFSDPVTLARAIGLPPRGMAVLQQHGLIAADEPLGPKTPRR